MHEERRWCWWQRKDTASPARTGWSPSLIDGPVAFFKPTDRAQPALSDYLRYPYRSVLIPGRAIRPSLQSDVLSVAAAQRVIRAERGNLMHMFHIQRSRERRALWRNADKLDAKVYFTGLCSPSFPYVSEDGRAKIGRHTTTARCIVTAA